MIVMHEGCCKWRRDSSPHAIRNCFTEDNERIERKRVMMDEYPLLNFILEAYLSECPCIGRHQRDHCNIFVECSLPISLLFPERGVGVGLVSCRMGFVFYPMYLKNTFQV